MFPVVSTNAPLLIVITTFPPLKFLTDIGNVFVLLSALNVGVPIVISSELTDEPSVVIVNFPSNSDFALSKAVSSVPIKSNVNVPNSSVSFANVYCALLILAFHTGFVASTSLNVYSLYALVFVAASTNAPAFIFNTTAPPVWFDHFNVYVSLVVDVEVVVIVGVTFVPPTVTVVFDTVNFDETLFNLTLSSPVTVIVYDWSSGLYTPVASFHCGGVTSAANEYSFGALTFPAASTNAPSFIFILTVPSFVRFFITNLNVFVFESTSVDSLISQSTAVPSNVILSIVDAFSTDASPFNATSSVPLNVTVNSFEDELYEFSTISSSHNGAVISTVNGSYSVLALLFPEVSTNAFADITIFTSPPVKLLIVIGNVFVASFNVAFPNVKLLELTVEPPTVIDTFDELNTDDGLFNPTSSEPFSSK